MDRLAERLMASNADRSIRAACRLALRRIDLRLEGLEHLPPTGPAIFAARHYHHLYDGCALLTAVPHPLHIVVALDWLEHPLGQRLMTAACRAAGWPIVSRVDSPRPSAAPSLAAMRKCVDILRAGEWLLLFPEGYPTIDPTYTPKTADDAVLPFRAGFLRIAGMIERDSQTRAPIVPVGLDYRRGDRWRLTVRFGEPQFVEPGAPLAPQVQAIERQVRRLSGLPEATGAVAATAAPRPTRER
jgi:1-acyl-sn-glycerol-3-phosphate acyltransferase